MTTLSSYRVRVYDSLHSPKETLLIVPGEVLRARASIGRPGDPDPLAVTGQVILSIVEVISKAPTYLKPVFPRHSDIASIK